jgi:hypothetical protein
MADFSNLRARLERAGLDPSSSEWLLKALSPATPSGSGCQVPDTSAVSTATPEFINSFTLSTYSAGHDWDCLILKPPSYPLLALAVCGPTGTDFTVDWVTSGCTVHVLQVEPGTSSVSDPHSVVMWNTFTGVWTVGALLQSLLPSTQPIAWRTTARSMTEYLVASDLNNQGTVTSGQYPARAQPVCTSTYGAPPNSAVYTVMGFEVPLSEANMTAMNPKVRVAPAKQGVYQPLYNTGPTFQWARGHDMPNLVLDWILGTTKTLFFAGEPFVNQPNWAGCTPVILAPSDPTQGTAQTQYIGTLGAFPAVAGNPYSWGLDNGMTGVSLYRGLSQNASLTVKSVLALEVVPAPTSPIRQFTRPAAANDPRALQLYYDLVHDMPHTYPASSNFLSAILSAVSSLLPQVLPHVAGIVQSARGVFGAVPNASTSRGESQPEMAASSSSRQLTSRSLRVVEAPRVVKVRSASVRSRASSLKPLLKKKKKRPARR